MDISFKSQNIIQKLSNFEQKKSYNHEKISAPLINKFEDSEIKQVNQQFKNIFDGLSFFQKPKKLNNKKNQIDNMNASNEIIKDNWKKKNKFRKKKEKKKNKFEIINENFIDTSIDKNNQNYFNECNMFNKNQIYSNSQNINLNRENESEDTTSFASDNNLSPNLTNSYKINSVEKNDKNQKYVNKNSNDIYDNYVNYLKQNNYEHELSLEKNYNNIVFFPNNDFKGGKKNNKKKKKKNNFINNNNINIINNYYVGIGNNINNLITLPNKFTNPNNYMNSNLNSNINYNYNSNSNNNYNNIEKTNKKNKLNFPNQNFINKINGLIIKKDNSNNFNENKIEENIELQNFIYENILNEDIDKKYEKENQNQKKYIRMSDILSSAPIKINQLSKPFIINEQYKKQQILLNLKIKIPNSDNYIEIPLRDDENPLLIFNNLKLDSTDDIKKIIYDKIEYSIYLIKYFKYLAISNNSVNRINELYRNVNIIN